MLEFALAYAERLSILCLILGALIAFLWILYCMAELERDKNPWKVSAFRMALFLALFLLALGIMPSTDNLWKVRINLLKYRLASPENVSKGTETISRIAHELECKYLKCKDKDGK